MCMFTKSGPERLRMRSHSGQLHTSYASASLIPRGSDCLRRCAHAARVPKLVFPVKLLRPNLPHNDLASTASSKF